MKSTTVQSASVRMKSTTVQSAGGRMNSITVEVLRRGAAACAAASVVGATAIELPSNAGVIAAIRTRQRAPLQTTGPKVRIRLHR